MPSTPTEAVLDVNVIIAAVFADHVQHVSARRFVEGLDHFRPTPVPFEHPVNLVHPVIPSFLAPAEECGARV